MPRLSVWLIRCSLLYLLAGFTLGGLLLANKGVLFAPWIWNLLHAHMEFLLLGWMAQLAMGVAFWILPRFGSGPPRGKEVLSYSSFVALNVGIWMVVLQPPGGPAALAVAGHVLEATAALLFVFGAWQRIKPLEA